MRTPEHHLRHAMTVPPDFTVEVLASGGTYDLELMVPPGTDYDSAFAAWDINQLELLTVNGWLFDIEELGRAN